MRDYMFVPNFETLLMKPSSTFQQNILKILFELKLTIIKQKAFDFNMRTNKITFESNLFLYVYCGK